MKPFSSFILTVMVSYSAEGARAYAEKSKELVSVEEETFELLRKVDLHGKKVLDFGCGNGRHAIKLVEEGAQKVVGIDENPEFVDAAKKEHALPEITYITAEGGALPFRDSSFDFVFSNFVVQHFENSRKAFHEIHRVLLPGGEALLVISLTRTEAADLSDTPIPVRLGETIVVQNFVKTKEQIERELEEAGLIIVTEQVIPEPDATVDSTYPQKERIISMDAGLYLVRK